jgi:hypothetical protein
MDDETAIIITDLDALTIAEPEPAPQPAAEVPPVDEPLLEEGEAEPVKAKKPKSDSDAAAMTIKSVPIATREAMGKLAAQRGQTMAKWLASVVERQAEVQIGDRIEIAKFEQPDPTMVYPVATSAPVPMTMAELRAGMEALAIGATASGLPMPK